MEITLKPFKRRRNALKGECYAYSDECSIRVRLGFNEGGRGMRVGNCKEYAVAVDPNTNWKYCEHHLNTYVLNSLKILLAQAQDLEKEDETVENNGAA